MKIKFEFYNCLFNTLSIEELEILQINWGSVYSYNIKKGYYFSITILNLEFLIKFLE